MPVTTDDILNGSKGLSKASASYRFQPIQPDQQAQPVVNTTPEAPTGVENVRYDVKTAEGTPNNPKSAGEVVSRGLAAPVQSADDSKRRLSYTEMYQMTSPYKPPSDEDLEKERKKQKREAIFAAIGEGLSAMSNLYFTTQYAPNSFDPSKGMAVITRKRFDRLKKDREENLRQYLDGLMRAKQMDDSAGYKDTLMQLKQNEQQRKEAESKISIALKQAELDYRDAKKDGQEYLNELYRLKGQALAAGMDLQVELIEEKIKTEKAKQDKYNRSGGSGGGSKTSTWIIVNDTTGEARTIQASSEANAYSQTPDGFHIRTKPTNEVTTSQETDRRGRVKKTKTLSKTRDGGKGYTPQEQDSTGGKTTANKWANASKIKY